MSKGTAPRSAGKSHKYTDADFRRNQERRLARHEKRQAKLEARKDRRANKGKAVEAVAVVAPKAEPQVVKAANASLYDAFLTEGNKVRVAQFKADAVKLDRDIENRADDLIRLVLDTLPRYMHRRAKTVAWRLAYKGDPDFSEAVRALKFAPTHPVDWDYAMNLFSYNRRGRKVAVAA